MRHHPLTTTGTGASDKRRPSAPPPPTQRETAMRARARMRHVPRAKTRGKRARERGGVPGVPRAGDGSGGGCGVSRDTAFWVAARRHSTAAVSRVNKATLRLKRDTPRRNAPVSDARDPEHARVPHFPPYPPTTITSLPRACSPLPALALPQSAAAAASRTRGSASPAAKVSARGNPSNANVPALQFVAAADASVDCGRSGIAACPAQRQLPFFPAGHALFGGGHHQQRVPQRNSISSSSRDTLPFPGSHQLALLLPPPACAPPRNLACPSPASRALSKRAGPPLSPSEQTPRTLRVRPDACARNFAQPSPPTATSQRPAPAPRILRALGKHAQGVCLGRQHHKPPHVPARARPCAAAALLAIPPSSGTARPFPTPPALSKRAGGLPRRLHGTDSAMDGTMSRAHALLHCQSPLRPHQLSAPSGRTPAPPHSQNVRGIYLDVSTLNVPRARAPAPLAPAAPAPAPRRHPATPQSPACSQNVRGIPLDVFTALIAPWMA
ncbi:hypothetical protein HWV62_2758 [Athelia sp. TMB]|nr:hypothetical protein HWV62_2758 [Athelia sp. TMB]